MFKIEIFNAEDHYPILKGWWDAQWPVAPNLEILSKLGVIVKDENDYLYGMFLYYSGSPIVWLEFIVSNPDVEPSRKRGALNFGIENICSIGKEVFSKDIKYVFSSSNNPGFINSMKKCGFVKGDENVIQLIKTI